MFGASVLICDGLGGVHPGLPVEEGSAEKKLEGAMVHSETQQPGLLHRGGPQGMPGKHHSGWELLCGGRAGKTGVV